MASISSGACEVESDDLLMKEEHPVVTYQPGISSYSGMPSTGARS